jgi:hypothetical protein
MRYSAIAPWLGVALSLTPWIAIAGDRASALLQAARANLLQPAVTILPASNGAAVGNGAGAASISVGQVAFYGGRPAAGVTERRSGTSLILSTRFDLKIACNAASKSSWAEVSVSLSAVDVSRSVRVDGATLSLAPIVKELPCSSVTGHWLEVEVSNTASEGPFDTALSFSVTNNR